MKSVECVAAFKPVSEEHAPEIQAELKQLHRCILEIRAETVTMKSEVVKLRSEVVKLRSENQTMSSKMQSLESIVFLMQKQSVLLGNEITSKLDRLLNAGGCASTSTDSAKRSAVLSSPAPTKKPTPTKRTPAKRHRLSPAELSTQQVQTAKYKLDLTRRKAFESAKAFFVPEMKSHPREVYHAFFVRPFGRFKGLLQAEEEAELLSVSKEDFFLQVVVSCSNSNPKNSP